MNVPIHDVDAHEAYINRELSWLSFARRVLELVEDTSLPLLERVKFAGIMGMINQLQDRRIIRELYLASQVGVPISLCVRGLCSLRAGVEGLSETIRVYSILGRFLEHSRIYRFENGGDPIILIGSSDWMKRNLDRRMESVMPVQNRQVKKELERILSVYESDNTNSWEMQPDSTYIRRTPEQGSEPITAQQVFI